MLNSLALTVALALSPAAPTHQEPVIPQASRAVRLFPLATQALVFGPEQSLAELVADYARITDQVASVDELSMSALIESRVNMAPVTSIQPGLVQQVFEQVLVDRGFMLSIITSVQPRVFSVHSIKLTKRAALRAKVAIVAREDLEAYRGHPALMVSTAVSLPNSDVGQLSNSIRSMITDANIQQILAAGTSRVMLVVGLGTGTVEMVDMLECIDAGNADIKAANPEQFEMMPVEHAQAVKCISLLTSLLGIREGETVTLPLGLRVVADPRTNSLLVRGYAGQMADVRRVLSLLDRKL